MTARHEVHPAVAHLLQFFRHGHLPAHLQEVSAQFGDLAHRMAAALPNNPETTVALRKILEAKDAAVRSAALAGRSVSAEVGG